MNHKSILEIQISPFKDVFLAQTEKLFIEYPQTFSDEDRHHWRQNLLTFLLKKEPDTFIFTAHETQNVIGAIMFHRDNKAVEKYWEIDWLVVKKDAQKQGIGTQLVKFAFKHIKEKDGKHVYLRTSSGEYNQSTLHFYKKIGFEKLANLPDYYSFTTNRHTYVENAVFPSLRNCLNTFLHNPLLPSNFPSELHFK